MAITLGSNIASLRGQRELAKTSSELGTVFQRLSSGQRINKASDDAAGLAIADSLNARSRILIQGVRNLNDGQSLLSIADSAIENLSDIVIRLEELAAQAANGVYTNKQRKAMDDEAQALSKEFFRISKATEFNGQKLLSGDFDKVNLQAGVGTNAVLSAGVGGAIGTGNFNPAVNIAVGTQPVSVASGDLNGDGIIDLVAANFGTNSASILLGLGNGAFAAPQTISLGSGPEDVILEDFSGDGNLDLVSANGADNTFTIRLGIGNGTFGNSVSTTTLTGPESLTTGDYNGDGLTDLGVVNFTVSAISIYLSSGNGTFTSAGSAATGVFPEFAATDDFNRDGVLDIATANRTDSTVSVLLGRGNGTFGTAVSIAVGTAPCGIVSGDFNQDGIFDLVTANSGTANGSILIGRGDGTFNSAVNFAAGTDPFFVAAADFNGDGILDLNFANQSPSTVTIVLGRGDGTFTGGTSYAAASDSRFSTASDLNGDGVLDLVTANLAGNNISVLIGTTKDGVAPLLPFSLKTMADARQALPVFKQKREQLAMQRGQMGAFQSRIGVALNVLQVSSENFKAAESRIRDADIAEESSRLIRLNILQQAAASVLAQANQQPALALRLLSG